MRHYGIKQLFLSCLIAALLLTAAGLTACGPDAPSSSSEDSLPSGTSEQSASESTEASGVSEPDPALSAFRSFSIDEFLQDETSYPGTVIDTEDYIREHFPTLPLTETDKPFLCPPAFTEDGHLEVLLVSYVRTGADGAYEFAYRVFRLSEDGSTWESAPFAGVPVPYDRNADNKEGGFSIEYGAGAKAGQPCPYAVLYGRKTDETPAVILFNEKTQEYPRILRQNDDYAVLSLMKDEDRTYRVIDRTGKILYTFNGEAAIAECAPLTFCGDTLLRKTDTDDDFEYDTLEILHLEDGSKTAAASFDNCGRWMYARNGTYVAAYDDEKAPTTLYFYDNQTGQTVSFDCPDDPGETLIPEAGVLLVKGTDGNGNAYSIWSANGEVLATVPGEDGLSAAVSGSLFAFGSADTVWIFDPSKA